MSQPITLPLSTPHGAPSPYRSSTITALAPSQKLDPLPACADCPELEWFVASDALTCFCRAFRHLSWESTEKTGWRKPRDPAVMACDARERAIKACQVQAERPAA